MSENMIERVAKAIIAKGQTSAATGLAHAAIEAMREPTPEMIRAYNLGLKNLIDATPELERAGKYGLRGRGGWLVPPHEKALWRWQAMIDAALDS